MNSKGCRLYQCDECKVKSKFHWVEFNRASRPKCPACGCSRLDLVTKEGGDMKAVANQVRVSGHRSMIMGRTRNRKVT